MIQTTISEVEIETAVNEAEAMPDNEVIEMVSLVPEKRNNNHIPVDYQDMYLSYFNGPSSLAYNTIRKFAQTESCSTISDLVSDAFMKAMTFNLLAKFDPSKANFGGAVYFTCRSVACDYLKHKAKDVIGNALSLSETLDETKIGVIALDTLYPTNDGADSVSLFRMKEYIPILEKVVASCKFRGSKKRWVSMPAFWKALQAGNTDIELASQFNISKATVKTWLDWLRDESYMMIKKSKV